MDLRLEGKKALVTGGSEGIGKAIALGLAREGVDVAICARRPDALAAAAEEIISATGRKIIPIPADLTKDVDARNFVESGHRARRFLAPRSAAQPHRDRRTGRNLQYHV